MNQVTPESKNAAIKTLAIVGFIVMIVVAVWIAVQIVQLLPGTFTRLANLAEEVENGAHDIVLTNSTIVTNAGETTTIEFRGVRDEGTYAFSYACAEGVAVALIGEDEHKAFIACDEEISLEDADPITLIVSSEKKRIVDLAYTITFTPVTGETPATASGTLTVTNADIPTTGIVASNEPTQTEDDPKETKPSTPTTPAAKPVTPVPGKPVTTIKYVTQIPQSDPKGFTDLAVSYAGSNTIDADDDASIKVAVINLGTKTSKDWDLTVDLPSGLEYELENEKGLKPNERATITIEFDASDLEGTETIEVEVSVSDDSKKSNDSFEKTVRFD